jgi:hypothetical protein
LVDVLIKRIRKVVPGWKILPKLVDYRPRKHVDRITCGGSVGSNERALRHDNGSTINGNATATLSTV